MSHDPGPWVAIEEPSLKMIRVSSGFAGESRVCTIHRPTAQQQRARDNARIIAAAPDLLAAAAEAVDISMIDSDDGALALAALSDIRAILRAAIAKAEGGAV